MNRFVSFSTSPAYVQQYNEVQKQMKEMLDNKNKVQHVHFEEPVTETPIPMQLTPPTPTTPTPTTSTPTTQTKEGYCDEHFHSISVAVVIIAIVIFFAFIIQLFSGSVEIKPNNTTLADDEIY